MRHSIVSIVVLLSLTSCSRPAPPPETARDRALRAGASGRELTLQDMWPESITGCLGKPLGTPTKVEGLIVESPTKFGLRYPNLQVTRIDGAAVEVPFTLYLKPFPLREFGKPYGDELFPPMTIGHWYELELYETGGFQGVPRVLNRRGGLVNFATIEHLWVSEFVVFAGREIEQPQSAPADNR